MAAAVDELTHTTMLLQVAGLGSVGGDPHRLVCQSSIICIVTIKAVDVAHKSSKVTHFFNVSMTATSSITTLKEQRINEHATIITSNK